jgi:hypothetical protein
VRLPFVYRVNLSVYDDKIGILGADHWAEKIKSEKKKNPPRVSCCLHGWNVWLHGEADSFPSRINSDFFRA